MLSIFAIMWTLFSLIEFPVILSQNYRETLMGRNGKLENQTSDDSQSSLIESLSEAGIRKELRSDAIQQPVTIISIAISTLSIIYLLLLSGLFGGSSGAIIILICSALVGAGSFYWHYSVRYSQAYSQRTKEIMALQDQEEKGFKETELRQTLKTLENEFSSLNSSEGQKAISELVYEYEQLQPIIESEKETDPLSLAYVPALANETYQQGLNVLMDALYLMKTVDSSIENRLESEVDQLEKEIGELKKNDNEAGRLKIRESTLILHKERLNMMNQQQLQIERLLYQADLCEASLHKTRMELTALKADTSKSSVNSVTETLQKTINQAKEVREELKKLGY